MKLVVYSEDHVASNEIEALVDHTLKAVLEREGHLTSEAFVWFLEDGTEIVLLDVPLHQISKSDKIVVHRHRCRKAHVTVEHEGRSHSNAFFPGQRVDHVKNWAVEHFKVDPSLKWYLTTDGTQKGELPGHDHIGKFVKPEVCSVKLLLEHVKPHLTTVTVINEDDGAEFKLEGTPSTTIEALIKEMYIKLHREPKNDDRLRCEEGGGDVFAFRNLTLGEYVKKGHCSCLVWLFAGGTGGATCR